MSNSSRGERVSRALWRTERHGCGIFDPRARARTRSCFMAPSDKRLLNMRDPFELLDLL